ncbi:MAG: hypothetical protein AB7P03_05410, partial [Kofleriaceae bacterium]
MLSRTGLVLVLAGFGSGCVGGSTKDKCMTASDCLDGLTCSEGLCQEGGNNNSSATGFGTVEPLTAASTGLAAIDYRSMIASTTSSGPLGCAMLGDMKAAPATASAAVYTVVGQDGTSGDVRCPNILVAIRNDPDNCRVSTNGRVEIEPKCAVYRRWDASGTMVAERYAISGYVMS